MSPNKPEGRTLKEIKAHKEQRKKWKEINLINKLKKQKLKEQEKLENAQKSTDTIPQIKKHPTISIAIPGSILENAQTQLLRVYLAGQFARAACAFCVDEVVVFDDFADEANARKLPIEDIDGTKIYYRRSVVQMGRILQYLEYPPYLQKYFPKSSDYKIAGSIYSLDAPHHLGPDDDFPFREGVITNKPLKAGGGSQANVGLSKDVHVDKRLKPGIRCTVKLLPQEEGSKKLKGILVSPTLPKEETGRYWGYKVRFANSLSQVFSKSPYKKGYDLTIGTSDKGVSIDDFKTSTYNHVLIVFGGLRGLEDALENDDALNVDDPALLFDHYLNVYPEQGSRIIRTEEAIWITLSALRPKLNWSLNMC